MNFVNFISMKGISQDFSNCGLRNDKYTKNQPFVSDIFLARFLGFNQNRLAVTCQGTLVVVVEIAAMIQFLL